MAPAGGQGEVVQACDVLPAQLDSGGCRVLLAGDAFDAGDRAMSSPCTSSLAKATLRRCAMGLLLADSQNLNADIWVELGLAGAVTSRLRLGPDVDLPSSAASPRWPPSPKLHSVVDLDGDGHAVRTFST